MNKEKLRVEDIWHRQGKIEISKELVKESSIDLITKIMSNLIIVRCEHMALEDKFYIQAISERFDELERNEAIPRYDVIIHKLADGGHKVEFDRMGEGQLW